MFKSTGFYMSAMNFLPRVLLMPRILAIYTAACTCYVLVVLMVHLACQSVSVPNSVTAGTH
jgi:hypothetical protein